MCSCVLMVVCVGGGFCDWCVLYNAYYNIHMYIILYMCGVLVLSYGLATEQKRNMKRRIFGGFVGFVVLKFICILCSIIIVRS